MFSPSGNRLELVSKGCYKYCCRILAQISLSRGQHCRRIIPCSLPEGAHLDHRSQRCRHWSQRCRHRSQRSVGIGLNVPIGLNVAIGLIRGKARHPPSPAWHSNQRGARHRDRKALRAPALHTPRRLLRAVSVIKPHHGSKVPRSFENASVRPRVTTTASMPKTTSLQCKACASWCQVSTKVGSQGTCSWCKRLLPTVRSKSLPPVVAQIYLSDSLVVPIC